MLLVHHTRKQKADDKFDMISGTNGLLGAADGAFLLQKQERTGNKATLEVSGRDQQDQKLYLQKNPESLAWDLEKVENELWKKPPEPLLENISEAMKNHAYWKGTPTDLVEFLGVQMKPNALSLKLNVNASRLFEEYEIKYEAMRTHKGRIVSLSNERVGRVDGVDDFGTIKNTDTTDTHRHASSLAEL